MKWIKSPGNGQLNDDLGVSGTVAGTITSILILLITLVGTIWAYEHLAGSRLALHISCILVCLAYLATPQETKFRLLLNVLFYLVCFLFLVIYLVGKYA